MGIFGSIWKGVTGPLRGIGNLVQGKFKKAIGAFGDTAKLAAPIMGATGFGLPIAAGVGALGGAASNWGEGKNVIKGAVGGAAGGAAGVAGRAAFSAGGPLSGIGNFITGGGSGVAETVAEEGVKKAGSGALSWLGKNAPLVTDVLGTGAKVYGANLEGEAAEREFALDEERLALRREEGERQAKQERMRMLMSLYGSTARF